MPSFQVASVVYANVCLGFWCKVLQHQTAHTNISTRRCLDALQERLGQRRFSTSSRERRHLFCVFAEAGTQLRAGPATTRHAPNYNYSYNSSNNNSNNTKNEINKYRNYNYNYTVETLRQCLNAFTVTTTTPIQ